MKRTTQLKNMLQDPQISFFMEAHNGLSAKVVEEAGFAGIWGSGLTISASLGVRDNNEISWTQVLDVMEFMSDKTSIPILMDGDTGFGNFNNVRRLVKKLEQRGVAGVCLEDKLFPKTNSFIAGEQQPLADMEEFCGKIKAGKDSQTDEDFCIIARVEAFIAGWGVEEALTRAYAYSEAGADAIVVHSGQKDAGEIFAFMDRWNHCKPVVIIPTMYYQTPVEEYEKKKVSMVIWANHLMRASLAAMQETAQKVLKEKTLVNIEKTIVPVSEIFRMQNVEEYKKAEEVYLPKGKEVKAIILAASQGENFGSLTDHRPKCMLEFNGKPILTTQVETLHACNIRNIITVVGYKKEAVDLPNLKYIENPEYEKNSLTSYYYAKDCLDGPCVISFGDVLYKKEVLQHLLEEDGDIVLAVDTSWWQGIKEYREIDSVIAEAPTSDHYLAQRCVPIKEIGTHINHETAHGEWAGIIKFSQKGAKLFKEEIEKFYREDQSIFYQSTINDFLNRLIKKDIAIMAHYFRGRWMDVDSIEDLSQSFHSLKER